MQTTDERFAMAITALAESYRVKATPGLFHGYRLGLAGLSIEAIERGAALALQRCKFMPTPAELRELTGSGGTSFESMAERAWQQCSEAVRRLGPEKSVNFADGATNAAVRLLGGWSRLCGLSREEFDKWARKDFIAAYVRLCRDGCPEELRGYHPGAFEIENARWIGRQLPGGKTYRLGQYGTEVCEVAARGYQPALTAPPAQQRLEGPIASRLGLEPLKRIKGQ